MINTISLAIDQKISLYKLKDTIVAYPTRSDLIKRLADKMVISTLTRLRYHISWYIKKRIPLLIGLALWGSIV